MKSAPGPVESIERAILIVRGHKVMLDADLAALYGVETRVLVQAVKRNLERFPKDFMFQLTNQELAAWRSQIVMSNPGAKMGLRALMTPPEPKKRPIGFVTPEEK